MAILTKNIDMRASQWEVAEIVVKGGFLPIERGMAGSTICPKTAVVLIILTVTGKTIGRCSLEYVILMTLFTVHPGMFSLQLEDR